MTQQNNEAFEALVSDAIRLAWDLRLNDSRKIYRALVATWQSAKANSEREIAELKAHINVLREALEFYAKMYAISHLSDVAREALASTPEQPLAEHDNEVLERAAKVCDRYHYIPDAAPYDCAKAIRALKGTS